MEKRWSQQQPDSDKVTALLQQLQVRPVVCKLLVERGIETYDDAKTFFRPSLEHLHNPFLMRDMDKAVERIEKAIRENEKILIYGDYDVDGTTSVALMYSFLVDFYPNIDYYIPDRYTEGYGISFKGIDYAGEHGCSLVIALDCGIKAVDKIEYASEKHIDFIICDHHLPGEKLPAAHAILDPKRSDCDYPYKELSGCGIGFKLIAAFSERNNIPFEVVERQLDLVAVSIASDIVPITGENRVLAFYGLKLINQQPRSGLQYLMDAGGLKTPVNITNLVFVVGPRINAAGRMDQANNAVRMLIAEKDHHALNGAALLDRQNADRKEIDKDITYEALDMIASSKKLLHQKTTVLFRPDWHKGVIGIVASRLIEKYYRPTIVLTESNGHVAGSARSVKGFNIYNAIKACEDHLIQFGGHKYAAGLTMDKEQIPAFRERFEEVVAATIPEELLIPEITIDGELLFSEITPKFFALIEQFAPFGPGNMRPVFVSREVTDTGYSRIVGENHLKLSMEQHGQRISGIAFGLGDKLEAIAANNNKSKRPKFDVCYTLTENEWQGERKIELNVKDIKLSNC